MGKAKKAKNKAALRFDPLARPADGPHAAQTSKEEKPLSAHQQRHMERKRLQAEATVLKNQKRKVSKADKIAWKRESKLISKTLQRNKNELRDANVKQFFAKTKRPRDEDDEDVAETTFGGFNLPTNLSTEPSIFASAGGTQTPSDVVMPTMRG